MKKIVYILVVAGLCFLAWKTFFSEKKEINVLVFSKTAGFRHANIPAGIEGLEKMGEKKGFSVFSTEDAKYFNEKELKKYNVIVFLNTTGDILTDAEQLEFNRWIQAGGGFVGIHSATDTEPDWTWYGGLVGAYFQSHPENPNVREAVVECLDKDHISTNMLPNRWTRNDEWYNYRDINPDINILLNLDESSYEGGNHGEDHPIGWYHEYDGGRSWYTGGGHTDEAFSDPLFLDHIWGGIQYAAGEGKPVDYNLANVAPEENRFIKEVLLDNLYEPTELESICQMVNYCSRKEGEQLLFIRSQKMKLL